MPKAVYVSPPLNTADIPKGGANVTINKVREVHDQWTSIGTVKHGLGLDVEYEDEIYSQIFSMDKEVLTGSIGRLLVSIGVNDTADKEFAKKIQALVGKEVRVVKRGDKVYWYPEVTPAP